MPSDLIVKTRHDDGDCVVKEVFIEDTADITRVPGRWCGSDAAKRRKLFHTACSTWAMVSSGLAHTMMGLAFPDLMLIIKQDLAISSWIFTAWNLGTMVGCLLAGFMYDRFNKLAILVTLSIGLSLAMGAIPWCASFTLMLVTHLIGGGFSSAIHSTVTADTMLLWGADKGTYLQIVHLAATAGGIMSPILVNPFLAKRYTNITNHPDIINNTTQVESDIMLHTSISNTSYDYHSDDDGKHTYEDTNIAYAYLIASVFTLVAAILYLIVYVTQGSVYPVNMTREASTSDTAASAMVSKTMTIVFVALVSLQIMVYTTMQRHVAGLFMTYAINQLNWSKRKTSNTIAAFWVLICCGRLVAVVAVRKWRENVLNRLYMLVTTLGIVGFTIASLTRNPISITTSLLISAFGMSPLFTFMFSWFSSHIARVTGKVIGAVYVLMALGSMTVPVISGYLMKNASYEWFLYLLVVLLALTILLTVVIRIVYRCSSKRSTC